VFSWIGRFNKVRIKKLIVIGIGYRSHHLSKALSETGGYQIVAYIDEEPWNHLHQMHGANIHYPSELLALAAKHRVDGVVGFGKEGWQPDKQCLIALTKLKTDYICLAVDTKTNEQLNIIHQRLLL